MVVAALRTAPGGAGMTGLLFWRLGTIRVVKARYIEPVPYGERRSSGLLISIILIVGLGGTVSLVWWWRARHRLPEGFEPMPAETPSKVAQLVAEGDRLYLDAMDHLKNSDPKLNPDWAAENRIALELFKKSNDSYIPAQDEYSGGRSPPSQLIDRIREASMRSFLCRKRSVAAERR